MRRWRRGVIRSKRWKELNSELQQVPPSPPSPLRETSRLADLRERRSRNTLGAGGFMEKNGKNEGDAIREHTPPEIQERIDSTLEERIRFYAAQPNKVIARRLKELEEEWDLDRMLTANVAGLAL